MLGTGDTLKSFSKNSMKNMIFNQFLHIFLCLEIAKRLAKRHSFTATLGMDIEHILH